MKPLNGIIVPSITIFEENFELNLELNSILFKHILLNGADSIFLFGGMGEGIFFYNNIEKKIQLIKLAYNISENKIPILCGVFGNQVDEILNQMELLGKKFSKISFVLAPPFNKKLNSTELNSYFENIFGSFNLDNRIILYNNPDSFANNKIKANHLKNLMEFSNIMGIKDTTMDINNTSSYLKFMDKNFYVYSGEELNFAKFFQIIPLKLRKYSGLVPSLGNISNFCRKFFDKALEGSTKEIQTLQNDLEEILNNMYDDQPYKGKEHRGLKYAFYYLYKNQISHSSNEVMNFSPELHRPLHNDTKKRIKLTVKELIQSNYIKVVKLN